MARTGHAGGPVCASNALTVVWVDGMEIRSTPDAPFSADNESETKPIPPLLGARMYHMSDDPDSVFFGYVAEIRGTVHPSDYSGAVDAARDVAGSWVAGEDASGDLFFVDSDPSRPRVPPPGNDAPPAACQSQVPSPAGFVYDCDSPGTFHAELARQPPGSILYFRKNFLQYATVNGLRCSDDFAWYARLTLRNGNSDGTGFAGVFSRPGSESDNSAGSGYTMLGRDQ